MKQEGRRFSRGYKNMIGRHNGDDQPNRAISTRHFLQLVMNTTLEFPYTFVSLDEPPQ